MARGLAVWLLIMAVETVHGILRGMFLAPAVGDAAAARIGWPIGAALVLGLATLTIRWIGRMRTGALFRLGMVWAVLTFAFEMVIGLLRGFDTERILAEIDPCTGGMLAYSLVVMALAPWLAARLRGLPA
jgi:hypothetical protein